jgi:hypothetical protein
MEQSEPIFIISLNIHDIGSLAWLWPLMGSLQISDEWFSNRSKWEMWYNQIAGTKYLCFIFSVQRSSYRYTESRPWWLLLIKMAQGYVLLFKLDLCGSRLLNHSSEIWRDPIKGHSHASDPMSWIFNDMINIGSDCSIATENICKFYFIIINNYLLELRV